MAASDARTLARQLSARSDESLAALFDARRVSPTSPWSDAFDAAEQLLDPASLARAITDLSAREAHALRAALDDAVPAGPDRDALVARALISDDGTAWDATAAALRAATVVSAPAAGSAGAARDDPAPDDAAPADAGSAEPGSADAASAGAAPATPGAPETDAAAAERAFTAVASLADVLQAALTSPLARIGAGTLGAADRRRLIESGAVADADAADELVAIAEQAGLLAADGRTLLVTAPGLTWLHSSTIERWRTVAAALIDALPRALRSGEDGEAGDRADRGWIDVDAWPGAYPYDPAWRARADAMLTALRRWAVLDATGAAPAWTRPAAAGGDIDADALAALLPPEVDRVYLQNDLTAIAPGSLAPHLDMRLRSMARRESRAQASSYRFTAESLADALTAGETAQTLRAFLEELSLTGLPQPLAYEIERSASRHGALRVGPDGLGHTRVTSDDEALLRTVAVDQALRPLGLVPSGEATGGDALLTRSSPDTAFWMIADARYPVVAVDENGDRRALDRHRLAGAAQPAPEPVAVYADLLARLRSAESGDADAAWLGRELEQAVRARETIVVAVRLPDGTEREFTIEATGLGGGRLRGLDRNVTSSARSPSRASPA
ncbi:helicase-associated domain-containing protein [Microbacterium lacticum]